MVETWCYNAIYNCENVNKQTLLIYYQYNICLILYDKWVIITLSNILKYKRKINFEYYILCSTDYLS